MTKARREASIPLTYLEFISGQIMMLAQLDNAAIECGCIKALSNPNSGKLDPQIDSLITFTFRP